MKVTIPCYMASIRILESGVHIVRGGVGFHSPPASFSQVIEMLWRKEIMLRSMRIRS